MRPLLWILLSLTLSPCTTWAEAPRWQFLQHQGHRLAYQCQGQGSPVIVLQPPSGIAAAEAFGPVLSDLSARRKVCFYERLGFAPSARPAPGLLQTAADYAQELAAVMNHAAPGEAQVVLGYSFGGFVARLHAATHPHQVKGLLLIDAAEEDWLRSMKAQMTPEDWGRMQDILDWFQRRLAHNVWDSQDEVRQTQLRADLPVRLLSRGLSFQRIRQAKLSEAGVALYNTLHDAGQARMEQLTQRTTRRIATRSEHLIVESEPEAVLAELDALLRSTAP